MANLANTNQGGAVVKRSKRSKNAVEKVAPVAAVAAADPTEQLEQGATEIEESAAALGYNVGATLVAAKQRGFVNGLGQALEEGQSSTAALFSEAISGAVNALL